MLNTIYSYGGSEALAAVFNGIAMLFKNGISDYIISIMTFIAITWAGIQTVIESHYKPQVKWVIRYVIILDLLILPKGSINIRDVISQEKVYKIDNLPIGLTIPAGFISGIGFAITTEFESVFSTVDYLPYHKYGTVFGAQLMSEAKNFKIQDPVFRENMEGFIDNCVMYDVMIGHKYSVSDLKNSSNLWELITAQSSKLRMFNYRDNKTGRKLVTCREGATKLEEYWNKDYALLEKKLPFISQFIDKGKTKDSLSQIFSNNISAVLSFYGSKQTSAQDTLKQLMTINAISDMPMSYGSIRAGQQQNSSWIIAGELAKQNLPIMHSIFEALIYASFILVFGLMLLPGGFKIAGTYFGMMMWIQLWPPLFAVLNLIINSFNKVNVKGLISDGITMDNVVSISNSGSLASAAAGGLGIFIPVISYMIVKGGAAQFVHIAGQLTSATQSASSAISNEVTSGNRSFDNVSLANQSFMSQSGFKRDFNTAVRQGHMEYSLNDGTIVKDMPGGNTITQGGPGITSSSGTKSFRQSDMISAQQHEQLGYERSLLNSQQKEYSDSRQSALRNSVDFVTRTAQAEANGEHFEYSKHTTEGKVFSKIIDTAKDLHANSNYSWQQASEYAMKFGGGVKADFNPIKAGGSGEGGGGGVSVGIGIDLGGSAAFSNNSSAQQGFGENHSASSRDSSIENIESVARVAKNMHFNTNQSNEKSLAEQVSGSYENMQQLRDSISVHQQNVNRIQENIDRTNSTSIIYDQDNYQDFVNYIAKQNNKYGRNIGSIQASRIIEQGGDEMKHYYQGYKSKKIAGSENMQQVNHLSNKDMPSYSDKVNQVIGRLDITDNLLNMVKQGGNNRLEPSNKDIKAQVQSKLKSEEQLENNIKQNKISNLNKGNKLQQKVDYNEGKRQKMFGLTKEEVTGD